MMKARGSRTKITPEYDMQLSLLPAKNDYNTNDTYGRGECFLLHLCQKQDKLSESLFG